MYSKARCAWLPAMMIAATAACRIGFDPAAADEADAAAIDAQTIDAASVQSVDAAIDAAPDAAVDASPALAAVWQQVSPTVESSGATIGAVLPGASSTNNSVVVWVWSWAYGDSTFVPGSVTDNYGNTYELLVTTKIGAGACAAGAAAGAIYLADLTNSGANHMISVDPAGDDSQQLSMVVAEYAGLVRTQPVVTSVATISAAPSPMTLQTGAVSVDGPALLLALASECSGYPAPVTWTPDAAWTTRGEEPRTDGIAPGSAIEHLNDMAGSFEASWTLAFDYTPEPAFAMLAAVR